MDQETSTYVQPTTPAAIYIFFHYVYHMFPCFSCFYHIWLVVSTPLKNSSQLGWLFPIYGKIKNGPNHQPVTFHCGFPTIHQSLRPTGAPSAGVDDAQEWPNHGMTDPMESMCRWVGGSLFSTQAGCVNSLLLNMAKWWILPGRMVT